MQPLNKEAPALDSRWRRHLDTKVYRVTELEEYRSTLFVYLVAIDGSDTFSAPLWNFHRAFAPCELTLVKEPSNG